MSLTGCTENSIVVHEGVDVFYQSPADQVDVLLVVDDSCSMDPYQEELSTNFEDFRAFLDSAEIQWHIAVTTTDAPAHLGELSDFIRWDDPDSEQRFREAVQVGTEGSGIEMGLEAAMLTLQDDHSGFVREAARFSAIFVSDEEDASPLSVTEYIRALEDLKGARDRDAVNASAVVTLDPELCENDWSAPGDRYQAAVEQTGGVVGDICSESFGPILSELSLSASRLQETFLLSELPNPATLILELDEQELDCAEGRWSYELVTEEGLQRPAIVFPREALPAPEQQIVARYRLGDGDPADFCVQGGP
jgi:hypothetical protein